MSDFDQKAQEWDKNKMHLDRTLAVATKLQEMVVLKPTMKALEFGAGTGLLSFQLKNNFSQITLVDSSREMLKMAEQKMEASDHSRIKTLFLDLENQEYHGVPFDIIYSQMVLHHVRDTSAIIRKFYNLLVPGGILAIADLYGEDGSFHDAGVDVHKGFDPQELIAILLQQGFRDIKIETCFVIRKQIAPDLIREYPVFLMTAQR